MPSTRLNKTKKSQIFCYTGRINTKDGTIYVYFTAKIPIISMDRMVAIFIIYDWKKNAILATPVKKYGRRNDSDLLQATDNIPLQKEVSN